MRKLTRLLGVRLFFLLLLIGVVVFLPLTLFIIRINSEHLMNEIVTEAKRTNDLIEGSVHYSMLKNQKEDVAQIIRALGQEKGVEGIRIYNKKGLIVFSTDDKELGRAVDMKAEQCTVCHAAERPLEYVPEPTRPRVFTSPQGYRVLAVINPIRNEEGCAKPTCHPPPSEQKILGVLDSKMTLADVDKNIVSSRNQMIFYSIIGIVVIELFTGLFIWRMVHRRVKDLSEGTRQVMEGNLDFTLDDTGRDEMGSLARSFNRMVVDLKRAQAENQEWSRTLEDKVDKKTRELKQAQEQMVQVAKMASMGKLAASVAHEINNPLGGILTYIKLLYKRMAQGPISDQERKTSADQLEIVITEVKRCGNIVKNMLHFSKSPDYLLEAVNIHELIDKSLFIVNHHLEINRITSVKNFGATNPILTGNCNQLQQALISLIINAVEAMPSGGTLTITTVNLPEQDAIMARVEDTGKGIPKEMQASIFEPFFTTKEETYGVGLGLSVVYGIVQGHQGTIEVDSDTGKGTSFIITLPRKRVADDGEKTDQPA